MKRSIKIAVDCRMLSDSGIGCYLKNILAYLIKIENLSFLLVGREEEIIEYEQNRNCQLLAINIPIFSIQELFHFPLKEINQCDCFYSPNFNIPLGIKIPIFCTIHDVLFLDIPITTSIKRLIYYAYLKMSISRSDMIFTVSHFSKDRILYHFPKASNKIVVTYNGIANYVLNAKQVKPYFDFQYFLYVGNIKPHKDLRTLLEAFNLLEKSEVNKKLVIVGNMYNFKTADVHIQTLLENGVFDRNIIFTGWVSNEDLLRILKYADLLIQPSVYEGFGIPPLESMYLGTPVILSDIQVFKEIYSEFPVVFFHCGNADDLSQKMINSSTKRVFLSDKLKFKYGYKKSAEIVYKNILLSLHRKVS